MDPGPLAPAAKKPRRRGSSSGQTAKKRELDRIAQKKSRERARNRMAELEEKIRRLQADDKQKQISELMGVIEDLRIDNERLRGMTEKIRSLTETIGPALKGILALIYLWILC
jgi:DNA repair exonuclease SbcCD ATPase subunit